jgi:hypothetical protein
MRMASCSFGAVKWSGGQGLKLRAASGAVRR